MKEDFSSLLTILKVFFGIVVVAILFVTIIALLVMGVWNFFITNIINIGPISFKIAVLIVILILLFHFAR